MKREDILKRLEPLIDKAIKLVKTEDEDKIIGAIIRLNGKATKENDYDAFIEVTIIGILLDEKDKI